MTLDDLRAAHPQLGFAVYAITPGEPVTLEVYSGDDVFSFTGPTEQEAIDRAFPPEPATPEPACNCRNIGDCDGSCQHPEPAPNVFD